MFINFSNNLHVYYITELLNLERYIQIHWYSNNLFQLVNQNGHGNELDSKYSLRS
jgi:hypothetical protein